MFDLELLAKNKPGWLSCNQYCLADVLTSTFFFLRKNSILMNFNYSTTNKYESFSKHVTLPEIDLFSLAL